MIYEFKLPDVGEGIAEGEIVKWLVSPKEQIDEDHPIAEIQTDKALIEITSPVAGTVRDIHYQEGEIAKVGSVIISFNTAELNKSLVQEAPKNTQVKEEITATEINQVPNRKKRVIATPTVRRIARELDVNLLLVEGSGKNGRVLEEDVRSFVNKKGKKQGAISDHGVHLQSAATVETTIDKPFAPITQKVNSQEKRVPLRGLRRSIANKMTTSTTVAAQSTILEEIDVTQLVSLRKQMAEKAKEKGVHLTYLPFIVKAVVPALKKFEYLNSSLDDQSEEIVLKYDYNIGIATDTENGLLVPVVKNANQKSLVDIASEISGLVEKARSQKITMEEISGGTFTITNIGATGVGIFGTPVINHPEAAILAIHRIQKKPVVVNNQIVIRDMLGLSLSFDHRILDGAMASYFLKQIIQYLEQPNLLFMEMV